MTVMTRPEGRRDQRAEPVDHVVDEGPGIDAVLGDAVGGAGDQAEQEVEQADEDESDQQGSEGPPPVVADQRVRTADRLEPLGALDHQHGDGERQGDEQIDAGKDQGQEADRQADDQHHAEPEQRVQALGGVGDRGTGVDRGAEVGLAERPEDRAHDHQVADHPDHRLGDGERYVAGFVEDHERVPNLVEGRVRVAHVDLAEGEQVEGEDERDHRHDDHGGEAQQAAEVAEVEVDRDVEDLPDAERSQVPSLDVRSG